MQVIITGGTGFIGRALSASFCRDGHQVIILSRRAGGVPGFHPSVRFVQWDTRSAASWGHLANEADAIVNLAGESIAGPGIVPRRWSVERKRQIAASRCDAGRAVVQAMETVHGKLPVLIQASAVGYYGPGDDAKITEECPAGNDFLAQVCVQWESSTQPVEPLGARRVLLRTGLVLSPHDGVLSRLMLPFEFFAGGPLGRGKQWYPWIHIGDVTRSHPLSDRFSSGQRCLQPDRTKPIDEL